MDPGALIGAGGQVGGEFLDPVLSAQGDAGGDGGADGVVALHLGGGAQGDILRAAAGRLCRGRHAGPDCLDLLLDGHMQSLFLYR